MNRRQTTLAVLSLGLVALIAEPLVAQPNAQPGKDVKLGILGSVARMTRTGSFPNGTVGMAMSTTSCNVGSIDLPWRAPMDPNHPCIAFMVTREEAGRMVQISDRSSVKHGFFALSNSQCTTCQHPSNGSFLGVGCSDTYGTGNNSDNNYLGPADEIDPWTGAWDPVCSHFDQGEPPVAPPNDCNGLRSSINPPDAVGHMMRIKDTDFQAAGTFYYQGYYMLQEEPEIARENNFGSRFFTPTWNGSRWVISVPSTGSGNGMVEGSVLERWSGSTLTSATNGADDGRVYLAVKVTALGGGNFHYEYAMHNRDNARGVKTFSIPVCPGSSVSNAAFRDVDADASNDWTVSQTATDLVFSTSTNALRWNAIFNFSFDCDAAPSGTSSVKLEQADAGPGFGQFALSTTTPMGATNDVDLGGATLGVNGLMPELRTCGDLSSAGSGQLVLRFALPSSQAFFVLSLASTPVPFWDSILVPFPITLLAPMSTDVNGSINFPIPGGSGPIDVFGQFLTADASRPFGYTFSNGLRIPLLP